MAGDGVEVGRRKAALPAHPRALLPHVHLQTQPPISNLSPSTGRPASSKCSRQRRLSKASSQSGHTSPRTILSTL